MQKNDQQEPSVYDALKDLLSGRLKWKDLELAREEESEIPQPRTQPLKETLAQIWHQGAQVSTPVTTLPLFWAALFSVILLVIGLRVYQLDTLQAEIYGDIATVYEYAQLVAEGQWPFDFILSAGPLYHYLIWPLMSWLGFSYLSLKIASVIASLFALLFTYLFARELVDDWFALLTTALAGVSSWLLIFSRLGNFPIILPALIMACLWLLVRYVKTGSQVALFLCALTASLGLYAYPQTFILPLAIFLTLLALYSARRLFSLADLGWFALYSFIFSVPFLIIFFSNPLGWMEGYIGGKLNSADSILPTLLKNIANGLGAFHFKGDMVGRSNPASLPHLDALSGLLFLLGFVYWSAPDRRRWLPVILIPFILLQLPSMLVLSNPQEVPSATRSLGVAPLAYFMSASGLWLVWLFFRNSNHRRFGIMLTGLTLLLITGINGYRYFNLYLSGLPYQNTPVARYISDYANTLPPSTEIYLVDCCWDFGMPEPKGVRYDMRQPDALKELNSSELTCSVLQELQTPAVLIWNERLEFPSNLLTNCPDSLVPQTYYSPRGFPVFRAASYSPQGALDRSPQSFMDAEKTSMPPVGLSSTSLEFEGQSVQVFYSRADIGQVESVFDGDKSTLMRGAEDNPLIIEMRFGEARLFSAIELTVATMQHFTVSVTLTFEDGTEAQLEGNYQDLPADPTVTLTHSTEQGILKLRVAITDVRSKPAEGFHVHVRELHLR